MSKKIDNETKDDSIKLKKLKNKSLSNNKTDISKDKISSFKPSFRCTECCLIPFLSLKENDSKISINCTNGHFREISINDYMLKGFQNNINDIRCSDCDASLEPKKRFKFCSECIKIFCKNCLKKHNNGIITTNHESISLKKMDTYCCLHKNKFTHYCELCHKNICENCFYMHNNHQIISLKKIKLSKNEIKELKDKLDKENNIIDEITEIFNNAINSIRKKFEDIINNKKLVLRFKKILEEIYEEKDANYQMIQNVNGLKFNNQKLSIQQDMNELDILFEIFNYLNCIDYNVCNTNSDLSSSNYNSSKTNSTINYDSHDNKTKKKYL